MFVVSRSFLFLHNRLAGSSRSSWALIPIVRGIKRPTVSDTAKKRDDNNGGYVWEGWWSGECVCVCEPSIWG